MSYFVLDSSIELPGKAGVVIDEPYLTSATRRLRWFGKQKWTSL